jgi:colanic acid/amylovoran biosynthesis glycosyltransferase
MDKKKEKAMVQKRSQKVIAFLLCAGMILCHVSVGAKEVSRILFVMGFFPVLSETFILNQITGLIDRGYDVRIHAFNQGVQETIHPDIYTYDLLSRTTYGKRIPGLEHCDIVYCQFGYHGQHVIKMLRKKKKKFSLLPPIITCFRGSDISSYTEKDPDVYRELFKYGDCFFPVCNYFADMLVGLGCNARKIIVHHSGIDTQRFAFKKRERSPNGVVTLVTVGRLVEKKGIDEAIRAVALLVPSHPISYIIVGDGKEKKNLQALVKKLHIEDYVTFYGWATQQEVVSILEHADIFLLPSVTGSDNNQEGIPNSLKEAMAMGVVVVSTYHAGIPELIQDGMSGFLVRPHDVCALAEKISYLLWRPERCAAMANKAREMVEKEFDRDRLLDRLEDIFHMLAAQKEVKR